MRSIIKLGIPFIFLVLLSNLWNVTGWIYSRGPIILDSVAFFFVLFAFFNCLSIHKLYHGSPYLRLINYLWIAPFVTVLVKMLWTGESFRSEVQQTLIMAMTFSSLYFLAKNKVTERQCLWLLVVFGSISFILQVYQLMHLDNCIFGFNTEGGSGTRNDIARLFIGSPLYAMFLVYFSWTNVIRCNGLKKIISIIGFVAFLISIYLYLTRQCIVAVCITIIASIFMQKNNRMKMVTLLLCCVLFIFLYNYSEKLFGDFIYMTQNDTYSTDIRKKAYPFFISRIFSDPIRLFVGHGHIEEISKIGVAKGLWADDIGIIGDMYYYGVLWGIAYFWMLTRTWKNRKFLPLYLKMYVFSTLIHSPMISAYANGLMAFLWTIVVYISMLRTTNSTLIDKAQSL